jgi:serine protease Do
MSVSLTPLRRALFAAALAGAALAAPAGHAAGPESVAQLAAVLSPAVVNINTRRMIGGGGMPFPEGPEGSLLDDMLENLNPNNGQGRGRMQEARSLGSGFVVSADGLVITNNHVIDGADEVEVLFPDGLSLSASVVGTDDKTDLAVLKVNADHELPFVEFGDSDTAIVGDWVMAIGNPFGLGGSVTLGIVSARNRDIRSGPYDQFIQTDASINQGNSGGPLFDMNGKVIGINTAIIARGGSSLGIGFAVPVNLARPVLDQLAEFGETRRGWLGVGIQEVTEEMAQSLGRTNTYGALVIDITPGGPSEGMITEGDIILEFNGKPIERMRDLPRVVAETTIGEPVPVLVLRDGGEQLVEIVVGRLEDGEQIIAALENPAPAAPEPEGLPTETAVPDFNDLVGFDIAALDETNRAEFAIGETVDGVLVTAVTDGSDAYQKGFLPGLVITQRKSTSVDDGNQLVTGAKEAGRQAVLFKVVDPTGNSRFVAVKLG